MNIPLVAILTLFAEARGISPKLKATENLTIATQISEYEREHPKEPLKHGSSTMVNTQRTKVGWSSEDHGTLRELFIFCIFFSFEIKRTGYQYDYS